jgi:hypothetical protein
MDVERRGDITEGDAFSQPLRREELEASPKSFAWLGKGSRVSREAHARFCERLRGQFPWPTHHLS